ncbi:MAG: hypothetical protein EXS05_22440 [Planctomycetaceae bacterium]|nr:hypothetical protein [Planctomycetaceae bacterium]
MNPFGVAFFIVISGLLVLLISLVVVWGNPDRQRAMDRAVELLREGATPHRTRELLVVEGIGTRIVDATMPRALIRFVTEFATNLLDQGKTEARVREQLVEMRLLPQEAVAELVQKLAGPTWYQKHPIFSVMVGLALETFGAGIIIARLNAGLPNFPVNRVNPPIFGEVDAYNFMAIVALVIGWKYLTRPFAKRRIKSTDSQI